jgi:hypothetical protein
MKYRWKKRGDEPDELWALYLILDGGKYAFAEITWYDYLDKWSVFISGFASEETVHVEKRYDLLCDAKNDVMDYAKVWFISGVFQRMNDDEKESWRRYEL